MRNPLDPMSEALRLTRAGKLMEATAVIQRALQPAGDRGPSAAGQKRAQVEAPLPALPSLGAWGPAAAEDVTFRDLPIAADDSWNEAPCEEVDASGLPRAVEADVEGTFELHAFAWGGRTWRYRLFMPAGGAQRRPVLVMLHGCKQDSADFAAGTGMNAVAQQHQCMVVYPEQLRTANQMGCWNWFERAHQGRDEGEPGMLVALIRELVADHDGDPDRVYVAGLSAGGAMAALLADLYPDVFAAVGVHSGIAPGAAHDVPSAFTAMRKSGGTPARVPARPVPTIVFQGSADRTVHPANSHRIVDAAVRGYRAAGEQLQRTQQKVDGGSRAALRSVHARPDGLPLVELWDVAAGPHAWSGGHAEGSYTDPLGPSASVHMMAFFLRHRRARVQ